MTSNLVVALRERGTGDIADGYEDKTERGTFDLLVADEIERLLAWQKKLIAEHVEAYREVSDENERLRAALEWYAKATWMEFANYDDTGRRARKALRPTDETTAKPSEFTDAQLEQHAEAMGWSSKACAHPVGSYVCPTCGVHVTSENGDGGTT